MASKAQMFVPKGMKRDFSASKADPQFAFANHNIRVTAINGSTLLSITNEKGNKKIKLDPQSFNIAHLTEAHTNNTLITCTFDRAITSFCILELTFDDNSTLDFEVSSSSESITITKVVHIVRAKFKYEDQRINTSGILALDTENLDNLLPFQGTILGHCVLNEYLVLFFKFNSHIPGMGNNYIVRLIDNNNKWLIKVVFRGCLNLQETHPIETLPIYENRDIQKVYWVDGINQPRSINIVEDYPVIISPQVNNCFDFVKSLSLEESITITPIEGGGSFPSGIVQYVFTYFDLYGSETHPFYVSNLFYTTPYNRGGSPEEKATTSFKLVIRNYDKTQPNRQIRIYSIVRTSLDAIPTTKIVATLPTTDNKESITFIDYNLSGSIIDPTELLYKGGDPIFPYTISHKDGTLFLGNYSLAVPTIPKEIRNAIKANSDVSFWSKTVDIAVPTKGVYPYDNQLKYSSSQILTFHGRECYRFGVQFLHKTGVWSEVLHVKDVRCEIVNTETGQVYPFNIEQLDDSTKLIEARITLPSSIYNQLDNLGFIKMRGMVVYPDLATREVVCQGILCPTVFRSGGRLNNKPYAQASWFARPNAPYRMPDDHSLEWVNEYPHIDDINTKWRSIYANLSEAAVKSSHLSVTLVDNLTNLGLSSVNLEVPTGSIREFRHNYRIPFTDRSNSELQIQSARSSLHTVYTESINNQADTFFVDQSILTLHSPEIEMDSRIANLNLHNLKLRIVGYGSVTGNQADMSIIASKPGRYTSKNIFSVDNISKSGFRSTNTIGAFTITDVITYATYPWHRNGSLTDADAPESGEREAMLENKILSNLEFCAKTTYLSDYWLFDTANSFETTDYKNSNHQGISDAVYFSGENPMVKIPAPKNSVETSDLIYYGEVNEIIYPYSEGYPVYSMIGSTPNAADKYSTDPIIMKYKSTPHIVIATNYTKDQKQVILPTIYEYPTEGTSDGKAIKINDLNKTVSTSSQFPFWQQKSLKEKKIINFVLVNTTKPSSDVGLLIWSSVDKLLYTWRSYDSHYDPSYLGPDLVSGYEVVKPDVTAIYVESTSADRYTIITDTTSPSRYNLVAYTSVVPLGEAYGIYQDAINFTTDYGFFWVGELYREMDIADRFGGDSEEALKENKWIPCSDPMKFMVYPAPTIRCTEGDTYYQRYDCLKTYAYAPKDSNSIVDIVSFMCETRINIDGRYDKNRGNVSNLQASPTNFDLLNPVYSQKDTFFPNNYIDATRFQLTNFPNSLIWSKTKNLGEEIDTWTELSTLSSMDLDGDKGAIESIRRFNNELYCFQPLGISRIFYNSHAQMLTQGEGSGNIPVELMNSGKVEGKAYITTQVGVSNKWSMVTTPSGLYFIDNLTNSLQLLSQDGVSDLSDKLSFRTWVSDVDTLEKWDPVNFKNVVSFYDSTNGDVYFITNNSNNTLCYSELIGQFISFFDYDNVPAMFPMNGQLYSFKNGYLWQHYVGDYNSFYGSIKPYSVEIICNADEPIDKIFNTIEWRATIKENSLDSTSTFDTIKVTTDGGYQDTGNVNIFNMVNSPRGGMIGTDASLRRKFRMWRIPIPRDNSIYGRGIDRMRGPWAKIKLSKKHPVTEQMELHDLVVRYFE